ncbi:MAG: SRPBCC family protein [Acidobacteriaceae bacterium]
MVDPRMTPFVFRAEQFVPKPLKEVFAYFSEAKNLQQLTPPWLHFHILSVDPEPARKGTLIQYSLRWRIFPIHWTTEIKEWEPPNGFVDVQLKGPYKLWHHEHRFVAEANGTRIMDEVQYELPLGSLGRLAHTLKVKKDVETIFAYREKMVRELFR